MDILQKLMEGAGTSTEPEEIKIDPAVEESINESTMPMSMLIETFVVNTEADINRAYEIYEMASIIGTTQVLQEGTNVQEAATAVMEGNIKDFFGKIIQKLREIGQWIAGIFKKIIHKGKNDEEVIKKNVAPKVPVAAKKVEEAAKDAPAASGSSDGDNGSSSDTGGSSGGSKSEKKQYYYRGDFWDPNEGDKSFNAALEGLNNAMVQLENLTNALTENWNYNAMQNHQWKETNNAVKGAYKEDNVITTEKLCENLMKRAFGKETKGAGTSNVTNSLKAAYGIGSGPGPNDKPVVVTPKLMSEMGRVLTGSNNVIKDIDKAEKEFQKRKDDIIKAMTKIQQTAEKAQADTGFITKRCTQVTSSVNAVAGMYVQVANAKKDAYISILNSYQACVNKIAQSAGEEVTDSIDYRHIIESFECCGDPILEGLDTSDDGGGAIGGFSSGSSIFSQLGGYLSI